MSARMNVLVAALGALALAACTQDDRTETERNLDQAGENAEEAGREVGEDLEDAGREIEEGARELGDKAEDAVEDADRELRDDAPPPKP